MTIRDIHHEICLKLPPSQRFNPKFIRESSRGEVVETTSFARASAASSSSTSTAVAVAADANKGKETKHDGVTEIFNQLVDELSAKNLILAAVNPVDMGMTTSLAYPHFSTVQSDIVTVRSLYSFKSAADGSLCRVVSILNASGRADDNHGPFSRFSAHWPDELRKALFTGPAIPGLFYMDIEDYVQIMSSSIVISHDMFSRNVLSKSYTATVLHYDEDIDPNRVVDLAQLDIDRKNKPDDPAPVIDKGMFM